MLLNWCEEITNIERQNYSSTKCIIFMRSTALLGDILLFFSIKRFCKIINLNIQRYWILLFSIMFNAGLVIVDNIHFQYNGIFFGILFLSLGSIAKKEYVLGAVFYCICICMKHILMKMRLYGVLRVY